LNTEPKPGSDGQGSTFYVILISCIATIGGFLFGYDSGVINGTVEGLQTTFESDSVGTGFNVASMLLGCAVGAFFAGRLADRYGRRSIMRIAAVFFIVSAWGSGIADSSLEFVFYRVLGGLALGASSILAPAYISEVTPARYRGRLGTVQQVAIISGLFMAFLSNYLIADAAGSSVALFWLGFEAWRWMFWVEILPATVFLLALALIPESPRYLVLIRRHEIAIEVLTTLSGRALAIQKVEEIDASLAEDHHRPRLTDLRDRTSGRIRRIVWVGLGLATLQQLVGINVVFYYGAVLWQSVGFIEGDALAINILSGGLSISLALLTYTFANAVTGPSGSLTLEGIYGPMALVAANIYVVFFNFSWGPVMWVMLGEMFPNQIRGSGLAVSGLAQWLSNFAITMTFPIMLSDIGLAGAYGFYTLCAFLSIWFVVKMVPETRGIELEEMRG
jgi:SP family sugar:H+ symporter-like MFS transporter